MIKKTSEERTIPIICQIQSQSPQSNMSIVRSEGASCVKLLFYMFNFSYVPWSVRWINYDWPKVVVDYTRYECRCKHIPTKKKFPWILIICPYAKILTPEGCQVQYKFGNIMLLVALNPCITMVEASIEMDRFRLRLNFLGNFELFVNLFLHEGLSMRFSCIIRNKEAWKSNSSHMIRKHTKWAWKQKRKSSYIRNQQH